MAAKKIAMTTKKRAAMLPQKGKRKYRLFDLRVTFEQRADYRTIEERITKIVGRATDGSGSGINIRDLEWYWLTKRKLMALLSKLADVKGVPGLEVQYAPAES